jgi:hypothetical protein
VGRKAFRSVYIDTVENIIKRIDYEDW